MWANCLNIQVYTGVQDFRLKWQWILALSCLIVQKKGGGGGGRDKT